LLSPCLQLEILRAAHKSVGQFNATLVRQPYTRDAELTQ